MNVQMQNSQPPVTNFSPMPIASYSPSGGSSQMDYTGSPKQQSFPQINTGVSQQIPSSQLNIAPHSQPSLPVHGPYTQLSVESPVLHNGGPGADLPPLRPVFGVNLEDLFNRDGSAVPMVVYQCLQAVDLFGLEVEGIYRLSGTASHITKLRSMFDNGMLYFMVRKAR